MIPSGLVWGERLGFGYRIWPLEEHWQHDNSAADGE
jgi:hypothetical protein